MKTQVITFGFILFSLAARAQDPFIKTVNDQDYGFNLRVLPASDNGWVVFSKDSLRLTKFNPCGIPEWSKKYHVPSTHAFLTDFIQNKSGGYSLLSRMDNGTKNVSLISAIDVNGQLLWSKAYADTFYDHFPYSLDMDNLGNLVVFSNTDHVDSKPMYNLVFKTDPNGTLIWSYIYAHGGTWGGAIVTSDNGVLVRTGNTFIKIDAAGQVQWTSQSFGPGGYYQVPVEVSDGYIYGSTTNPGNYICFFKMDKQGNLLWNGYRKTDFTGNPPVMRRKSNDHIVGVFGKTIIEFDKDLQVMAQSTIDLTHSGVGYTGNDICFISNDTPILAGVVGKVPFFSKMKNDYTTECTITRPQLTCTTEPVTIPVIGTNFLPYSLTVSNHTFSADDLSVTVTDTCKKQNFLDLGQDTSICKGFEMTLQNLTSDEFDHYLWSNGDTTYTTTIYQPGVYWLTTKNECGEDTWSDTLVVGELPAVVSDLGDDQVKCEGIPITLSVPLCDSCVYIWNTGIHINSILVEQPGTYWLTIDNLNGCISTDTVWIDEAKCACSLYVPNAFTPNQDGKNELFKIYYDCEMQNFNLAIFNRLGQKIFETDNMNEGWQGKFKGKPVMEGVYVYVVQYDPIIKGKSTDTVIKRGTLTVVY